MMMLSGRRFITAAFVWALLMTACAGPMTRDAREALQDRTARWFEIAESEALDYRVAVIVPSRTREGVEIDHGYWRDETIRIMSSLFGGATATPAEGGWVDDGQDGRLIKEQVSVVESYMRREDWNEANARMIREHVMRMKRETDQGEMGIVVNGRFYLLQ